ncbi:hypothetical protein Tco_0449582 [Tanacetum coccineum]
MVEPKPVKKMSKKDLLKLDEELAFKLKAEEEEEERLAREKAQQRSIMCTYLKKMEGWKPKSLKNKSFANIQELFNKAMNEKARLFVQFLEKRRKYFAAKRAEEKRNKPPARAPTNGFCNEQRFNTTAGNPVKKILLKLNLSDHRILKDGGEVKEFQRSFSHSDTERLSRSDEVLKLKNFKKDATLKLFKSTNQERYEHVGPKSQVLQDGKVH